MALPKVISLYINLSLKDRKRFGEFVSSPFYNKRPKLVKLLVYAEDTFVGEDSNGWDKQAAFKKIFGEEKFSELQLNNLLSDLYKLGEKFLIQLQIEKDKELRDVALIESFVDSNARNKAEIYLNKKKNESGATDFYKQYKLNLLTDKFYFQKTRKSDNSFLEKSQEQLDLFFISTQLKIWCELLNRTNVLSLKPDEQHLKRFEDVLINYLPLYQENPFVSLYYPLFIWLKNINNDNWYSGYLQKLFDHLHKLPAEEGKEICNYIQNYCVKRINEGRGEFLFELFEVFKIMLNNNLAYEGNFLPQWTYKNIVTVGVRLKEFAWTENFIHTYYQKLPHEERDNAYQYNLAVLYYEKGDIQHALQLLNKVHFTDPNYYLDARSILLKIYFEQLSYEALMSLKDAVKIYLLRDKQLSKSQKMLYKNLFNYTFRLFKLQIDKDYTNQEQWIKLLEALQEEIQNNALVANKQWLLAKIESL